MSEMRIEMMNIKFDEEAPDGFVYCGPEEADGLAIAFTALHPTELTRAVSADGVPVGKQQPQEYGLLVVTEELFTLETIPEHIINAATKALKEAGCLTWEDASTECDCVND